MTVGSPQSVRKFVHLINISGRTGVNMSKIRVFILCFGLLLVLGGYLCYRNSKKELTSKNETNRSIKLGNEKNPFFLRAKIWGITGNHEEIVLSQSDSRWSDKEKDYIFYTSEVFFKVEKDSIIFLYAPESAIGEPLTKIKNVKIIGLNDADSIKDYNINYKKYGLQRLSVYK